MRYFAVGEYGPVHFRPHYHLLLFLQSDEALQICSENISKAWTLGRVDCQVSKGQCSNYVASYVNSSCTIPKVFKASSVCPFNVHSQKLGQGFLDRQREKYTRLPLKALLKEASYSMENIKSLTYGGRVTLFSTHDVKDLLLNLHVNVLTLTQSMIQRGYYSPMPKRRSRLRKK